MTNEEAIEVLRKIAFYVPTEVINPSDFYLSLDLAIKALETGEVYMTGEDYNLYMEGYKAGKKDFEPKQGEWNYIQAGMCVCPFCGHKIQVTEQFLSKVTECEVCGADMRGAETD